MRATKRLLEHDMQIERSVRRRLADKLVFQEEQTRMHEEQARLQEGHARTAYLMMQQERVRREKAEYRAEKQTKYGIGRRGLEGPGGIF